MGGRLLLTARTPGSPAIDAGDPNFTPPPFYDQRGPGFGRVINGRIDIGSFEVQNGKPSPTPTPTASPTPTAIGTATPTSTATATPTPTSAGCAVTSPNCGTTVFSPPTDFIVNLSPPGPGNVQASDFTVNGIPANTFMIVSGGATIHFYFNTSPAVQGQNTIHISACAFTCIKGCVPEFTCTFFYEPPTPTPTPTATATSTPTPTPTGTATPRLNPTPRLHPIPAPRP